MLERVGEALLDDAVGGEVDPRRELQPLSLEAQGHRQSRLLDLRDQLVEMLQPRLGRKSGMAFGAGRHQAQHTPHLGQRLPADLLDRQQRLALAALLLPEQPPHARRLHHHHRDGVRDHVVQLAGDPRALVGRRLLDGDRACTVRLRDTRTELARLVRARRERAAGEPGAAVEDERADQVARRRVGEAGLHVDHRGHAEGQPDERALTVANRPERHQDGDPREPAEVDVREAGRVDGRGEGERRERDARGRERVPPPEEERQHEEDARRREHRLVDLAVLDDDLDLDGHGECDDECVDHVSTQSHPGTPPGHGLTVARGGITGRRPYRRRRRHPRGGRRTRRPVSRELWVSQPLGAEAKVESRIEPGPPAANRVRSLRLSSSPPAR